MTHEDQRHGEIGGPEHDHRLPDAAAIPVHDDPEGSFAPELTEDIDDQSAAYGADPAGWSPEGD